MLSITTTGFAEAGVEDSTRVAPIVGVGVPAGTTIRSGSVETGSIGAVLDVDAGVRVSAGITTPRAGALVCEGFSVVGTSVRAGVTVLVGSPVLGAVVPAGTTMRVGAGVSTGCAVDAGFSG